MAYETILYEVSERVATITLNRPDKLNAFNDVMIQESIDAFKQAGRSDDVRCVLITGAGRGFSSGQDLKDVQEREDNFSIGDHLRRGYNRLIERMVTLEKPVIGAINGVAAGAGCGITLGAVLHPMEAWLLQRGLMTFGMRMARHNDNALAVARFLEQHPAVREVYYPGLESHPQYDLACKQMPGGFSGMVCFDLAGGLQAGYTLLEEIELINLAVSLGGVHSLITHPASTISKIQSEEGAKASGVQPGLVRLSVGLEDVEDIIADLDQALLATL